jgi:hypothetical protein
VDPRDQDLRPTLETQIEYDLHRLHRRGLQSPKLFELHRLIDVAKALSDKPTDRERIEQVLAAAIDAYGASDSRRDVARTWFGLVKATRHMTSTQRHRAAFEVYGSGELDSFRTNIGPLHYPILAHRLYERYEEACAGRAQPVPYAIPSPPLTSQPEMSDLPAAEADQGTAKPAAGPNGIDRQRRRSHLALAAVVLAAGLVVVIRLVLPTLLTQDHSAYSTQLETAAYAKNVTKRSAYTAAGTTADPGNELGLEVYYHNLSAPNSGRDAVDVWLTVELDQRKRTTDHTVRVVVSARNAKAVGATTHVITARPTRLAFMPGTVTWKHDIGSNAHPRWILTHRSDYFVTSPTGGIIEHVMQPCNNFAATLAFRVAVMA